MPDGPALSAVACTPMPTAPCPDDGGLVKGGRVKLTGSDLETTTKIVFLGGRGRRDDVSVRPALASHEEVEAKVSTRARSGRVMVVNRRGERVTSTKRVRVARANPGNAAVATTRFFFDAEARPSFSFTADTGGSVRVELLRQYDGAVVRTWDVQAVAGQPGSVVWDGNTDAGAAQNGQYSFRIAATATGARASDGTSSFGYYDHIFPIRGRHDMGYGATNDFGGDRDHKGQDMFAKCGTSVVAARGGTVEYAGYQDAAGYYVVIDGAGTDVDYVYMHLLSSPLVATGDRVKTGQRIGEVGETGRATGCHLHFEMWSGPGWYEGGAAFDPRPQLETWDAYS